jgi:thiamine biosynthesis protein ThiS
MSIKITVNGNELEIPKESTIDDLLNIRQVSVKMFVVEKNFEIIQKENYGQKIEENDNIEIVGFFGGG